MYESVVDACRRWLEANLETILATREGANLRSWWKMVNSVSSIKEGLRGAGVVMVRMKREGGGLPDGMAEADARDLDAQTRFLGAENGVIDLDTGALLNGSEARDQLITHTVRDAYDPAARHPAVDKLLGHLGSRERGWLLDSLGYALRGNPSRRALLIVGGGGGGKSTLLSALSACLGTGASGYAGVMGEGALSGQKNVSAGLNPEMSVFQLPKRLVVVGEENRLADIGRFKQITGGDEIAVRRPYEPDGQARRVSATMIQAINEDSLPSLKLEHEATYDRIRALPYPSIRAEERDHGLRDVLINDPRARQALVALLVKHAVSNPFPPMDIPSVADKRAELRRESVGAGFHDWALDSHRGDQGGKLTRCGPRMRSNRPSQLRWTTERGLRTPRGA